MANAKVWTQRVKQWRSSGMTAAEFVERKDFAQGTLRYWAWRLGKASQATSVPPRWSHGRRKFFECAITSKEIVA